MKFQKENCIFNGIIFEIVVVVNFKQTDKLVISVFCAAWKYNPTALIAVIVALLTSFISELEAYNLEEKKRIIIFSIWFNFVVYLLIYYYFILFITINVI